METRNILAEIFLSLPGHIWVIPFAFAVTYFGLRAADASFYSGEKIKWAMYICLLAIAVIPNGYLALFTPTPDMPDLLMRREALPNYLGLFYLDAFFTFVGWVVCKIVRSRF